jgi:hypothetical protein
MFSRYSRSKIGKNRMLLNVYKRTRLKRMRLFTTLCLAIFAGEEYEQRREILVQAEATPIDHRCDAFRSLATL